MGCPPTLKHTATWRTCSVWDRGRRRSFSAAVKPVSSSATFSGSFPPMSGSDPHLVAVGPSQRAKQKSTRAKPTHVHCSATICSPAPHARVPPHFFCNATKLTCAYGWQPVVGHPDRASERNNGELQELWTTARQLTETRRDETSVMQGVAPHPLVSVRPLIQGP